MMKIKYIFDHGKRYIYYYRKAKKSKLYRILMLICGRKHGLEIGMESQIGEHFMMLHPYNITVSGYAVVGEYCTMLKGSTIGVNPGENWGAPHIGNRVYIGLNSSVIGKITIGDDVLIAPNTLVNRDVPSHSVVIGTPHDYS